MYIVGITGASGVVMGIKLIEELLAAKKDVVSILSEAALANIHFELFKNREKPDTLSAILVKRNFDYDSKNFCEYNNKDLFAPVASGTADIDAVIIIPCSMKTLAGISSGYSDCLINRAADAALKENRKCIIVPRETPFNLIHLQNLVKAKQAGADILIPVPAFYTFPETIDDVINYVVGKTLNLLGIDHELFPAWGKDHL
jgi:flavin prenyltransferase